MKKFILVLLVILGLSSCGRDNSTRIEDMNIEAKKHEHNKEHENNINEGGFYVSYLNSLEEFDRWLNTKLIYIYDEKINHKEVAKISEIITNNNIDLEHLENNQNKIEEIIDANVDKQNIVKSESILSNYHSIFSLALAALRHDQIDFHINTLKDIVWYESRSKHKTFFTEQELSAEDLLKKIQKKRKRFAYYYIYQRKYINALRKNMENLRQQIYQHFKQEIEKDKEGYKSIISKMGK